MTARLVRLLHWLRHWRHRSTAQVPLFGCLVTTNRDMFEHFKMSRRRMGLSELARCLAWLDECFPRPPT